MANEKQRTLGGSFSLSSKGLHTGLNLTVTFMPAPENHGYKIQRIDLPGQPIIDALAENVGETTRGTVLQVGDVRCSTIEHGLSALYACGIDNVLIQVDGPEFPILDGSAEFYIENIKRVGIVEQEAEKNFLVIEEKMELIDDQTGSYFCIEPADTFSVDVTISFPSKILGSQKAELNDMSLFAENIARARTFVFVREIELLLMAGLIKGGDLDNAIVIYEKQMTQEALDKLCDLTGCEHHDCNEHGYIQHKPLVWENECARHKLLDVIGDMALVGRPLKGRITAVRPGHTINNKFARLIRKNI